MSRIWHVTLAVIIAGTPLARPVWAERSNDQGGGQAAPQATSQAVPASGYQPLTEQPLNPSAPLTDNIVAYQPIPNSALPDHATVLAQAQPQAMNAMMGPSPVQQAPSLQSRAPRAGNYDYGTWVIGNGPYTLGRDDVLHIQVRNQPDFTGDYVIGPEGEIQYSYLGDVKVLGKNKQEIEELLTKMLEKYVRTPQVTVTVVAYNSKAVYIIGEVNRPGKYAMRGDVIKLREAIVAAGLPTRYAALQRTHIVKPDLQEAKDRKIDLKKILYQGKLKEDIDLYPGEIIVVPSTVLHKVDLFLSDLLDPVTRASAAAAIGAGL